MASRWASVANTRPEIADATERRSLPILGASTDEECAMRFETLAVHAGAEVDTETGALAPPIHLATTFRHGAAGEKTGGFEYQREAHPTGDRLERALAAVEGGVSGLAFASGMAAMTALLGSLPREVEVIVPVDCYNGVRALANDVLVEKSIIVRTIDTTDPWAVRDALTDRTAAVCLETPSNPLLEISDIRTIVGLAKERSAKVFCDNTFATPVLQRPIELGVDVVLHSMTKYIGGHHDALGGMLVFRERDAFFDRVERRRLVTGATLSPMASYLMLRGLRSLPARMAIHCKNARIVAEFLASQTAISRVHYPGLASDPGHAVASHQMADYGGMVSFRMRDGEQAALELASRLTLITNATSLGGVETTIEHRASIESPDPASPVDLLRLSVGLEHPDDLLDDLRAALAFVA